VLKLIVENYQNIQENILKPEIIPPKIEEKK
jgi:hypothetical protein